MTFGGPVMILFFSTLLSEDLAFLFGLFKVQAHEITAFHFILFYSLGVLLGDIGLYYLGVFIRKHSDKPYARFIKKYIDKIKNRKKENFNDFTFFDEFLAFTRFIPGTRIPTYTYCGISGYSLVKFSAILFASSLIYSSLAVAVVKFFMMQNSAEIGGWSKFIIALISALVTVFVFKTIVLVFNFNRRYKEIWRPLKTSLLRYRYLEFWPTALRYLPLLPYFTYLLLKHRGLKSILSANPGIEMSGLIGELKSEIDILLGKYVSHQRLQVFKVPENTVESLEKVVKENSLTFPLVLKPDSGMRGTDVHIVNNMDEAKEVIQSSLKPQILQPLCSYNNEWGVYYYRFPGEKSGKFLSITVKEKPFVIGNGKDSLLDLVFKDSLLSPRFDYIFKEKSLNPHRVPKDKEIVQLVFKGSHSKGCVFKDGSEWVDSEQLNGLRHELDKIEGFNVGRIDVKFDSLKGLERGDFEIIEINGVGGESSNFYDPDLKRSEAYEIIKQQWRLVFEIGYLHRTKNKVTQKNIWELFVAIYRYGRIS